MVKTFKKELKVKNYLLNLSDEELDSIADAFKNTEFERISTKEIIKVLTRI